MEPRRRPRRKRHPIRNIIIILILALFAGGTAYGMHKYQSLKNTVKSSYKASGVKKLRNVDEQLSAKKPISILLMGTDTGALGRTFAGRTDSMMVVTINPKTDKTTITSLPRDTAVNIPGYENYGVSKINAAYAYGKSKTAITTVQQMLNVPIDFYAIINMGGMEKIIDEVGGVTLTPTLSFSYGGYTFKKGVKTHMNGKKALAYSRMRDDDPKGDYGRQTRQRKVIMALLKKSGSVSTLLNEAFISSLTKQTQTDLTFNDLTALARTYLSATQHIKTTHLQGTSETINSQSMEVASKSELQRVTNYICNGLSLEYKATGTIANMDTAATATTSTDTTESNGDAGGSNGGGY
ncbi:LCP family protein [Levilactobacillus parabrevis]|uniref:Transcriptional regulator n=1 Tax=Levilactobacillus parabrevis ATCC 53295 TaxID=1267003 RepID=A0A0R1GYF6_9LACO|nr:LCP family protein [Levilactobacillus parabrevis]KRK36500.1 transcriptional regulator [Levilactobacillus parabrevis ATCC 53295]KRO05842.1 transcriptional regulator [Levilactobacillus parabrevis]